MSSTTKASNHTLLNQLHWISSEDGWSQRWLERNWEWTFVPSRQMLLPLNRADLYQQLTSPATGQHCCTQIQGACFRHIVLYWRGSAWTFLWWINIKKTLPLTRHSVQLCKVWRFWASVRWESVAPHKYLLCQASGAQVAAQGSSRALLWCSAG